MNRKFFNVTFDDRNVFITLVAIVLLGKLSSEVFTAFTPSEFGILVYKDFTFSSTRYELSRTVSAAISLLIKSHVSVTYGIC